MMADRLIPKRRFKGFEDAGAWERHKLGDVVDFLDERRRPLESGLRKAGPYPYYGASGIIDYVNDYIFDEELILLSEDGANIIDRNYRVCFMARGKYWVNNHAHVLKAKNNYYNEFICEALERLDYTKYNTGTAQPKLNQEVCRNINILIPNFDEQIQISTFFTNLDNLITLHQRKLNKLNKTKSAYLSEMFPAEGEKHPTRRFAGFTDPWEQREFENVFDKLQNNSLSRANLNYVHGIANNVHYGDILTIFGECLDVGKVELPYINNGNSVDKYKTSFLENGDVVFADAAEDETVGKCIEIQGLTTQVIISGLHTIPCRPKQNFGRGYLGYYLNSDAYHDQLLPLIQGTKVSSISRTALNKTYIKYPESKEEQRQIGSFFANLDNLITLQQGKLNKLQDLKKAYLEELFV